MTPNLSDNLGQTTIYLRVSIAVQPILSRMTALPPPHERKKSSAQSQLEHCYGIIIV